MSCKKEKKTPEADESILKIDLSMREDVSPEEMEERLEEDLDETLGELEDELEDVEDDIDDLSDELDDLNAHFPKEDAPKYAASVKKRDELIAELHELEVRRDALVAEIAEMEESIR